MENGIYQGRTICTFDLKDREGYYLEELVLEWKQAAAEKKLTCVECGAPVYLAAGQVREPYFAHYDLVDCDYGSGNESEELKKGKRLLYSLLKRSFPEGDVTARYRMDNGMYSTLFCRSGYDRDITVDYRLQNNSLEKYQERDAYYQGENLLRIYLLGSRMDKENKQLDWYQNLLQNAMGYVALLDTDKEWLILKKSFSYRIGKKRKFRICKRSYPIREIVLRQDGWMECDFKEECEKISIMVAEEKERYQLELEKERKRKEQEEQYRREQEERYHPESVKELSQQEIARLAERNELDPTLLAKCLRMIEEGNGHLVSRKYNDAIYHHYRK